MNSEGSRMFQEAIGMNSEGSRIVRGAPELVLIALGLPKSLRNSFRGLSGKFLVKKSRAEGIFVLQLYIHLHLESISVIPEDANGGYVESRKGVQLLSISGFRVLVALAPE
jgi:hypothetical protein